MPAAPHVNVGEDAEKGRNIHKVNLGSDSATESDTEPETKVLHGVLVSYLTDLVISCNLNPFAQPTNRGRTSLDDLAPKSETDSATEDETEDEKEVRKRGLYLDSRMGASKRQKIG